MKPEKVNRYLNRRKEREAVLALNRLSVIRLREMERQRYIAAKGIVKTTPLRRESNKEAGQVLKYVNSMAFPPAPPQHEEVNLQREQQGPLDMQTNKLSSRKG